MSKISLQSKENRYKTVLASLEGLEDEIRFKVKDKEKIVIKPNFVDPKKTFASTHPDALQALLDFLAKITDKKIILAEAPINGSLEKVAENLGYTDLIEKYNLELKDLNQDKLVEKFYSAQGLYENKKINIAQTVLNKKNYVISLCPAKTHDTFIVTLSLKNLAVGATVVDGTPDSQGEKKYIRYIYHNGVQDGNVLLFQVINDVYPDLSLIDGWQAMQGNGPIWGTPVEWKLAVCGTQPLAVDVLVAEMMGFKADKIGYLKYMQEKNQTVDQVQISGEDIERFRQNFKPHKDYAEQLRWVLK